MLRPLCPHLGKRPQRILIADIFGSAFMTFLHGPRSCIGLSFAKSEFAILVASWVGRFNLELDNKEMMDEEKLDIKGGITARPAKGMHIRATVLDGW